MTCNVKCEVTDTEETADDALLRRLREAIGEGHAASVSEEHQLEAVLRLLVDHPGAPHATPPSPTGLTSVSVPQSG